MCIGVSLEYTKLCTMCMQCQERPGERYIWRPWRQEERTVKHIGQEDRAMGRKIGNLTKPCCLCVDLHVLSVCSVWVTGGLCAVYSPCTSWLGCFLTQGVGMLDEGHCWAGDVMWPDLGAVHIYEFTATFLKLHTFDVCSFLHRHYTVKKKNNQDCLPCSWTHYHLVDKIALGWPVGDSACNALHLKKPENLSSVTGTM